MEDTTMCLFCAVCGSLDNNGYEICEHCEEMLVAEQTYVEPIIMDYCDCCGNIN